MLILCWSFVSSSVDVVDLWTKEMHSSVERTTVSSLMEGVKHIFPCSCSSDTVNTTDIFQFTVTVTHNSLFSCRLIDVCSGNGLTVYM